jgi:aspartyl-tRNA(Asn)/glutamyl-tRNA(Gln) amidotransferase subunit C
MDVPATVIAELADLAKLALSDGERERARAELARILAAFEQIAPIPTDGVEASPYPLPLTAPGRTDAAGEPLAQSDVLANAPDARAGAFAVPRVVEG